MATEFPCFVEMCPWEATLRDGVWLCEKHDAATFVFDDEARVVWPKIAEMDARIRAACERLIQGLHRNSDAFGMFMDLTDMALGLEKTVKSLPPTSPHTSEAFKR